MLYIVLFFKLYFFKDFFFNFLIIFRKVPKDVSYTQSLINLIFFFLVIKSLD